MAPKIESQNNQFTKVTLYSKEDFDMTTKEDRIIRDTLDAKLIKPMDPETAPRYMKYVPFWA